MEIEVKGQSYIEAEKISLYQDHISFALSFGWKGSSKSSLWNLHKKNIRNLTEGLR